MNRSIDWLLGKFRPKHTFFTWCIENFDHEKLRSEIYDPADNKTKMINGLYSNSFNFFLTQIDSNNCKRSGCLSLMRDPVESSESSNEEFSPWLRLTLSTYNPWLPQHFTPQDVDSRNVCIAWISSKHAKYMATLTGGFHSYPRKGLNEFSVTNPEFVLYDDLFDKGYLKDNNLTIVCEIHALTSDASIINNWLFLPIQPVIVHQLEHTLAKDLKRMLDTGDGSDVTLVANNGQQFPAHVTILSSRSPVFAAMFQHDMKEKLDKRVRIEDLSSNAVKGLLEFIYTDTVSDITALASELLRAAHKYDMPRLKTLCEEAMVSHLKTENAADYYRLADLHDAQQLRTAAKQFATKHLKEVRTTDGWKTLLSHSPQLADEITGELAELMSQIASS